VAKQQPERRFTLLYDKVCRRDILQEAWRRVKSNKGAAGVDQVDIDSIRDYGEERFLIELEQELRSRQYRVAWVRRVHMQKPGQPGKTRPLGIPTVKDRVVQMAVKLVIEPLFEADFMPCSFGFRPKKTPRMALSAIVQSINDGYSFVVDVDLKSYFDTISHELLLELVERRVGDVQVLRLIRAWLKAGVMEEGKVTHPDRGSPQGGVMTPRTQKVTSILSGGWGSDESRVRIDVWRIGLYVYDRCRVPAMLRRPSASIAHWPCFATGTSYPMRSSDLRRNVPYLPVKPIVISNKLGI
jgi:retron-type reverse transcriptase